MERRCQRCGTLDIHHFQGWDRRLTCDATRTSRTFLLDTRPAPPPERFCSTCGVSLDQGH